MAHIPVRHPAGDLRSCESAVLPIRHMLMLDGVYENVEQPQRKPRLHRARAPTSAQLTSLADTIANRVCRHLARNGWLEGEEDSAFLSERAGGDDGLDALRMSSITYRIATGTQAGRKVVTLQTIPADADPLEGDAGSATAPCVALPPTSLSAWAQRLKRVFNIDVTTCMNCGGAARIVASVEDPTAIRAILAHFDKHGVLEHAHYRPRPRPRNRKSGHAHQAAKTSIGPDAATTPQGCARPAVGNRREMAANWPQTVAW